MLLIGQRLVPPGKTRWGLWPKQKPPDQRPEGQEFLKIVTASIIWAVARSAQRGATHQLGVAAGKVCLSQI